jgi:hypothetical protein
MAGADQLSGLSFVKPWRISSSRHNKSTQAHRGRCRERRFDMEKALFDELADVVGG